MWQIQNTFKVCDILFSTSCKSGVVIMPRNFSGSGWCWGLGPNPAGAVWHDLARDWLLWLPMELWQGKIVSVISHDIKHVGKAWQGYVFWIFQALEEGLAAGLAEDKTWILVLHVQLQPEPYCAQTSTAQTNYIYNKCIFDNHTLSQPQTKYNHVTKRKLLSLGWFCVGWFIGWFLLSNEKSIIVLNRFLSGHHNQPVWILQKHTITNSIWAWSDPQGLFAVKVWFSIPATSPRPLFVAALLL